MSWNKLLTILHLVVGSWFVWYAVYWGLITKPDSEPFTYYLVGAMTAITATTCYGIYALKNWARLLSILLQSLAIIFLLGTSATVIFWYGFDLRMMFDMYLPVGLLITGILIMKQPEVVKLYGCEPSS